MQLPSIGRIVEYFPATNGLKLPNSMTSAPAMITQICGSYVNLNVFTADPDGNPVKQAWSVPHKQGVIIVEGYSYWDWPERV